MTGLLQHQAWLQLLAPVQMCWAALQLLPEAQLAAAAAKPARAAERQPGGEQMSNLQCSLLPRICVVTPPCYAARCSTALTTHLLAGLAPGLLGASSRLLALLLQELGSSSFRLGCKLSCCLPLLLLPLRLNAIR